MRKRNFYIIVFLLYLVIPVLGVAFISTMVTDKYQVQDAKLFVKMDAKKQSVEKTNEQLKEINEIENEVKLTQKGILIMGMIIFITATGMIIKRKLIIKPVANKSYN